MQYKKIKEETMADWHVLPRGLQECVVEQLGRQAGALAVTSHGCCTLSAPFLRQALQIEVLRCLQSNSRVDDRICGCPYFSLPAGITSIGPNAFECSRLTSITIPLGVTSIGDCAFLQCSRLTSITIPLSVTAIGENCFSGCSSLTRIHLPSELTSIAAWAFAGCRSLRTVNFPTNLTTIEVAAFQNCTSMTVVDLPDGLESIGVCAFMGCSSLITGSLPDYLNDIGKRAFEGCDQLNSAFLQQIHSIAPGAIPNASFCEACDEYYPRMEVTSYGQSFVGPNGNQIFSACRDCAQQLWGGERPGISDNSASWH